MNRLNGHSKTEDTYELTSMSHSKAHHPPRPKWYSPQRWGRTCVGWVVGVFVVVLILVIVVIVQIKAAGRYPVYSQLQYKLVDVYRGETFFDKFDYFTG